MNGEDFIRLSGKLAASARGDAATFRTAANRAYYGAMHLARGLLDGLGFRPSRLENAHVFLQQLLIGCEQPFAAQAGSLLSELHGDRIRADYRLDYQPADEQDFARTAVETAHQLVALLQVCQQEPIRSEIAAGIRRYQQARRGEPS